MLKYSWHTYNVSRYQYAHTPPPQYWGGGGGLSAHLIGHYVPPHGTHVFIINPIDCFLSVFLLYIIRLPAGNTVGRGLAFTRYCHRQYCMVYGIQRGGVGGEAYNAK